MRRLARLFSGPLMIAAGINHFVMPKTYEQIMPRSLPAHRELVYASGVAEIAGAAATLHPATRRAGGLLLIATLLGVFPANLQMTLNPERYPKIPRWALWARLPLQGLMIWWVWLATQREAPGT
jgi:uncharacterized membrane protein